MHRRSITFQIMVPSLILVVLGFLAVGAFTASSKARSMSEMFRRKAELSASLSQEGATSGLWQFDQAILQDTLHPIIDDPDFKYVIVSTAKGEQFYASGASEVHDISVRAIDEAATSAKPVVVDSNGYLLSVVPLIHRENGEVLSLGTMVIAYDKSLVTAAVWSAVWWVVGIVVIAVAMFSMALVLLLRRIIRPLAELTSSMTSLSRGVLDTQISNLERGDEIGVMARSVQVFKDNAVQLRASETETGRLRVETERQRCKTEEERAVTAAQQADVVATLAIGLEHLSGGELTFRMERPFPPAYEKLKSDFNGAMDRMQETISALQAAIATIQSGTQQITSAADDLSQRTGEQAASLKQTAAALVQIAATVRRGGTAPLTPATS